MKQLLLITLTLFTMASQAQESNWHFTNSTTTQAKPDQIWKVWTDVAQWKDWDKGLKDAKIQGEFVLHAKGWIIPDKGPKSKFIISELNPGQSYTMKTKIPFGWLVINRSLKRMNDQTIFTHEIEFTGLLKKVLGRKLGERYREMLPEVMNKIAELANEK